MTTYIGAITLIVFGIVILAVGITIGGGLIETIALGGLILASGIIMILVEYFNKKKNKLEEETKTND